MGRVLQKLVEIEQISIFPINFTNCQFNCIIFVKEQWNLSQPIALHRYPIYLSCSKYCKSQGTEKIHSKILLLERKNTMLCYVAQRQYYSVP